MPIIELLSLLRERDDHMAVVVDEFDSAIGMITMEDIPLADLSKAGCVTSQASMNLSWRPAGASRSSRPTRLP